MAARRKPFALRNIVADMKDFDWEVYLLNYPELAQQGVRTKADAHNHYKKIGFWEKRSCAVSDKFDVAAYTAKHAHLGFRSPRDAYVHFMRVGKLAVRNDGFRRNIRPYRLPVAPSLQKRYIAPTTPAPAPPAPALVLAPRPRPHPFRRSPVPALVAAMSSNAPKPNPATTKPFSAASSALRPAKHRSVKQPKPGELVLNEPPSSYFKKICIIGPPKILN